MHVAVIGLGVMGGGIASRLAGRGHRVTAYNRTRARVDALQSAGVAGAGTPRAAAAEAEAVILMLSDDAATMACVEGADGILSSLKPGTLVVQMGTISPETTLKLAAAVEAEGAAFLDAPMMGSKNEAAGGKLWLLVGADPAVLERARPLLRDMAQEVYHVGPVGQGTRLKLANNLLGGHLIVALAETMALIEAAGIDPGLYAHVLADTNLGTRMLAGKAAQMIAADYEPRFSIANERKDVGLALQLARALRLDLPHGEHLTQPFDAAAARGLGERDIAAMRLLDRASG